MFINHKGITMRYLYSLGLCLLSLYTFNSYSDSKPQSKQDRAASISPELKIEFMREVSDFLETQDPAVLAELKKDKEAYKQFLKEVSREILARRGKKCNGIVRYSIARDKEHILKLFADNWYWFVATGTYFDPEGFLNTGEKELQGKGKSDAKIFVYCLQGKPLAFISYYKLGTLGKLQFVGNDKENTANYEYVEKLVQFALDDLRKMGANRVELLTRTDNLNDRALYKKLGFSEVDYYGEDDEDEEDKYVELRKLLVPPYSKKGMLPILEEREL